MFNQMPNEVYTEVLKVWNGEMPDEFDIYSEFYYEMFGDMWDTEEQ